MPFRFVRLALALVLGLLAAQDAVAASKLSERQMRRAEEFAANNSLFFLYHEVGHLLIDQLSLPVLGKEEDAADNMATYVLLRQKTRAADRILTDSAYGWLLSGDEYNATLEKSDFYDAHALDHQRAYQIVCLMVGSSRERFGKVADDYEIDKERQESCRYDYLTVERSMEALLGPEQGKNHTGSEVEIHYAPVYSGEYKLAADVFERSGIFEDVAAEIQTNYGLPNKVAFNARACGEPNAYYDDQSIEVIFCYELFQDLLRLISEDMPEDVIPTFTAGRVGPQSD
jgi:hypothetical protein